MLIEMAEKRRWFSKVFSDSQASRTDTDISWSNSDSDQENNATPAVRKRIKITDVLQRSNSKNWINVSFNKTPPKTNIEQLVANSRIQDDFLESPILSELKLEEQSPILTQNDDCYIKQQSPVLSRNKIMRKIRWRCKQKKGQRKAVKTVQDESNPALSQQVVITTTPTQISPCKTEIHISPAKSELSQACDIDPFPSQHCSEVVSDSWTSSISDPTFFSYQPPPRRKRYRKGGLASQLQKAINLQNSSAAIWEHEVFLSRTKSEDEQELSCVSDGIEFYVINKWKEYGCNILECKCNSNQDMKKIFSQFSCLELENFNTFLIITGAVDSSNISFEVKDSCKICLPYDLKIVSHQSKQTICIVNPSRFISF